MRYQTEMMREILQNPKAQEIIDFVSPIYGESYVGLWIYEAIGTVLYEVYNIATQLMEETSPATANILLSYWEQAYGIPTDTSLTIEQRRLRILAKTHTIGPCTPERLAAAVSDALGGVPVEVTESTAKNTFKVNIREDVPSINPAVAVIEQMKPAHLIYTLQVAIKTITEDEIKIAVAQTRAEIYKVEVHQ